MQFDVPAALARVVESYGGLHGSARTSVWLSSDAINHNSRSSPEGDASFVMKWCWARADQAIKDTSLPPFTGEEMFTLAGASLSQLRKEIEIITPLPSGATPTTTHSESTGACFCGCGRSGGSVIEGEWISIFTPLLHRSHNHNNEKEEDYSYNVALLGVLLTESLIRNVNSQDTNDQEREKQGEADAMKEAISSFIEKKQQTRKVAAELISTLLTAGPRWGVVSVPHLPEGSSLRKDFSIEESLSRFMNLFETYRKKPQRNATSSPHLLSPKQQHETHPKYNTHNTQMTCGM